MEEEALDYLPVEKVSQSLESQIIKYCHRFLVFNFWHFIIIYLLYVLRTYFYVGHMPYWKNPIYSDLPSTFLWETHKLWVFITILIAYCSVWLWILFHVLNLMKAITMSYTREWAWTLFGFLGILFYKWLKYESSFGFHNWFFD